MPSVISHLAVPLAIGTAAGTASVPVKLAVAACVASALPDVDALGFRAGVPYNAPFGHRGFTHSLFFALLVALFCSAFATRLGAPMAVIFGVVFLSTASHGVLDAMTTGGLGVAFFSPFSNTRYFLPWRMILVSPLGVSRFFSDRGIAVLMSELVWVWAPCALTAMLGFLIRRMVWIA